MSDALDIKWSKEDGLLSGDPEAMPKLIAAQRLTIAQQAQEMERLNKENASLAAGSCESPYGDDYGNKRCKAIDDLQSNLAAMTAEVRRLQEELKRYKHD